MVCCSIVKNLENIAFFLVTKQQIGEKSDFLKERFEKSKSIVGTRKFHAFIPTVNSTNSLYVKRFSSSPHKISKII